MKVVYMPAEGTRQEWPFTPDDINVMDASFIKKQTRMTHAEWKKALLDQDADALHGLLWVLQKSDGNPLMRWTDVRFRMNEVTFEFDDAEVDALIDALAGLSPDDEDESRVALVSMLTEQGVDVQARIAERLADPEFIPPPPAAEGEQDPKA